VASSNLNRSKRFRQTSIWVGWRPVDGDPANPSRDVAKPYRRDRSITQPLRTRVSGTRLGCQVLAGAERPADSLAPTAVRLEAATHSLIQRNRFDLPTKPA
jgi:hypothetical protein